MRRLADVIHDKKPLTLSPTIAVTRACEYMRDHHASAVLVANEKGHLVGIFTGRDAVYRVLATAKNAERTTLGDVMTDNPITMPSHKTAIDALRLMWDGGFRHLPIIHNGKIVGLVSRRDFKGEEQDRLDEERELWEHMR